MDRGAIGISPANRNVPIKYIVKIEFFIIPSILFN
tara:strand:- start:469 stop:573 length:105 start_codon:yes stop_codon:yes gene_type:complete